jgi:hypothetical protein
MLPDQNKATVNALAGETAVDKQGSGQPFASSVPAGATCPQCQGDDTVYAFIAGKWGWRCQGDECRHWWDVTQLADLELWPGGQNAAPRMHHYADAKREIETRRNAYEYWH